ncbi:hypothetical protein [Micromonospora sp. DH14]|uniref:hypothetical protein n=1 Tax=Micromonospora sp. DH14 TaxID=3040120 RepID=UPI0024412692|nr:hypothetical protein [Micromonospora sp. DH14]MDG9673221.1 hypothetical protein [Micromonospora sp. DH14]
MRRQMLAIPVLLALVLAGCGAGGDDGGGVATAGGTKAVATASGAPVSDSDQQLAFAKCMRENGVDLPDPEAGGGRPNFRFGADVDQQKAREAMEKCQDKLPNGGQRPPLNPEQAEQMRTLAKCMRENGVPDFPDPDADGRVQMGTGGNAMRMGDPAMRAALEKCRQYAPQFGGGR